MVYALIVYVDCELFYRLTFGHKKRDLYGSLNCSKRRERFMNLSYYSIEIQLITYQYTLMGYELGNIQKRTLSVGQ